VGVGGTQNPTAAYGIFSVKGSSGGVEVGLLRTMEINSHRKSLVAGSERTENMDVD
jgi:hypothetical protein